MNLGGDRSLLRRAVPRPIRRALRHAVGSQPSSQTASGDLYADLYEAHAQTLPPESSIGGGDYDEMGAVMLTALIAAGLKPDDFLVDFGCGTGRLAVHAIPYLDKGRYLGTDISATMLAHARERVAPLLATSTCEVGFVRQEGRTFALEDNSVDMICAFSVFTHLEHEDTFVYLVDARRAIRDGGHFVASLLSLDVGGHQEVFLRSAVLPLEQRLQEIRHVLTTPEHFGAMAWLAGWYMDAWYPGDVASIPVVDAPSTLAFLGQSVCVLRTGEQLSRVREWWERVRGAIS